jgi:hypothetical protein
MPEIASMREDFPALCQPMTAMAGMSSSTSALQHRYATSGKELRQRYAPKSAHMSEKLKHGLASG